jgi:hypothetical protein
VRIVESDFLHEHVEESFAEELEETGEVMGFGVTPPGHGFVQYPSSDVTNYDLVEEHPH